jgi:hypothetical protein
VESLRHPLFDRWLGQLAANDDLLEVFGEVLALLEALDTYGRELEDDGQEESHRVVTSMCDMHALRRAPPSVAAPYADEPPVLRISTSGARTSRDQARRCPSFSWEETRRRSRTAGTHPILPLPRDGSRTSHDATRSYDRSREDEHDT